MKKSTCIWCSNKFDFKKGKIFCSYSCSDRANRVVRLKELFRLSPDERIRRDRMMDFYRERDENFG